MDFYRSCMKSRANPDKALDHYKLFHSLKEAVAGESSARQIAILKMSHKVETTQRDMEIQRLQNIKLQLEIDEQKRNPVDFGKPGNARLIDQSL
jgi:hypothetical protein